MLGIHLDSHGKTLEQGTKLETTVTDRLGTGGKAGGKAGGKTGGKEGDNARATTMCIYCRKMLREVSSCKV